MNDLIVTFWGPRGTLSCSGPDYQEFGGHTVCVSALWKDHLVIFDTGSGIYNLGQWVFEQDRILRISIFVTHYHMDHIVGYPFFGPAWNKNYTIDVHGGNLENLGGVENFFTKTICHPIFPISLKIMTADMRYHDITAGQKIDLEDDLRVTSLAMNHPGGSLGYKLISPKGEICYITDHEHKIGETNQALIDFTHKSKLTIYDSTYDDDTFSPKIGWGHSTWQEGLRLQKAAEIEQMAIFHHDPSSTDTYLNDLNKKISKDAQAFVAKQGQVLLF